MTVYNPKTAGTIGEVLSKTGDFGAAGAVGKAVSKIGGPGKHRGSGQERNYDVANANDVFKQQTGRDLTQAEIDWLSYRGDVGKTGHDVAAQQLAAGYKQLSGQIMSEAQAAGINLTLEQANQLRDKTYVPGDQYTHDNFMSLIRPQLETLAVKQKEAELKNPLGTATPEQAAGYKSTAERLLNETLGGTPDPDMVSYVQGELAKGETPFEVKQILQQTPQYLKQQSDIEDKRIATENEAARGTLNTELLKYENEAFQRALPDIIGQFQRAGRLNSSGLEAAIARERANLAKDREQFLSNTAFNQDIARQGYRREDVVGARAQSFNQYLRQNEPSYQSNLAFSQLPYQTYQRGLQGADQRQQRSYDYQDYNRAKNDFNDYLGQSKKQSQQQALYGAGGQILGSLPYYFF